VWRKERVRTGKLFGNRTKILSPVALQRPHRAGKYSVDSAGFEEFLHEVPVFHAIQSSSSWMRSGKWNPYPHSSEKTILQILDSDRPFIATIAESSPPFIDRIRCRRDVLLS